jgi:prolyl-tRNA synthetase
MGGREAAAGTASAVGRQGGAKLLLGPDGLEEAIERTLQEADLKLGEAADAAFRSAFALVRKLEELQGIPRIAQFAWCGEEGCGHRVEEAIDGALLGTPEGPPPLASEGPGACIACGRTEGTRWALAARPL